MNNIAGHDKSYRRGLVLGLTMAEIVILIIFCLLLALATSLSFKDKEIKDLRNHLDKIKELSGQPDKFDELFNELELAKQQAQEAGELSKRVQTLQEKVQQLSQIEVLLKETDTTKIPDSKSMENLINSAEIGRAVESAAKEEGKPLDPDVLKKMIADSIDKATQTKHIEDLEREKSTLQGQVQNIQNKIEAMGHGTELPACWADPKTGKSEYIFNISLTSQGFSIKDNQLPQRAKEQAELPISKIQFQNEINSSDFRAQTQPLFDWGTKHNCRFFVQVRDLTAAEEKSIYKERLQVLEDHFYKLVTSNEE